MWLCLSAVITTNALSFEKDDIKWIFEVIFDEKQSYRDGVAKKSLVKNVKYSQGVLIRKLN